MIRDEQFGPDGLVYFKQWPDAADGDIDDNGTVRAMTADEAALLRARLDADAVAADKAARIQAIAAKSIDQLEASAAAIDARADFYAAAADATTGTAVQYVNTHTDDIAALARRVADLQQTVAHLIRLTVIDRGA